MQRQPTSTTVIALAAVLLLALAYSYLSAPRVDQTGPKADLHRVSDTQRTDSRPRSEGTHTPGDVREPTPGPAAHDTGSKTQPVATIRLGRADPDYRFLEASLRKVGQVLPTRLDVPPDVAARLRNIIEPHRKRADIIRSELNNSLQKLAEATVASGGGERYSVDDASQKKSIATQVRPQHEEQLVIYLSRNGANYVVRVDPGQSQEVDVFTSGIRDEHIACANTVLRTFGNVITPVLTPLRK